jgi:RNA polymerase sigma factor (sigma-70 family)
VTDEALFLEVTQRHCDRSLASLCERWRRAAIATVHNCGCRRDELDVYQDSVIKLLRGIRFFRGESVASLRAFFLNTVRHTVIDRWRRRRDAPERASGDVDDSFEPLWTETAEHMEASDIVAQVLRHMSIKAPPLFRAWMLHCEVEDFDVEASILGVTRGSAEQQVSRARVFCRHTIDSILDTGPQRQLGIAYLASRKTRDELEEKSLIPPPKSQTRARSSVISKQMALVAFS